MAVGSLLAPPAFAAEGTTSLLMQRYDALNKAPVEAKWVVQHGTLCCIVHNKAQCIMQALCVCVHAFYVYATV